MAYCSQADLEKLVGPEVLAELTTDVGEMADTEVVAAAIAQADAEIDAYLAKRYRLPLASVPPVVKALSIDIALYHLHSRREGMPPIREEKYKRAVAFLTDVARGLAEIVGADGAEVTGDDSEVAEITSNDRVFSRDTLKNW